MGTRIVPGYCKHIEVDADNHSTVAGTGGLSSGDLYYNTTSSSYVLKS